MSLWMAGLVFVSGARAENLLYNSGFELGYDGYGCTRFMELPGPTTFLYPEKDPGSPVQGSSCLKITNPEKNSLIFRTHSVDVTPDTFYTFSIWLKSDHKATKVKLTMASVVEIAPSKMSWDGRVQEVVVDDQWKRYEVTGKPKAGHSYIYADLIWGGERDGATVWLDGAQINAGKEALPYQPAAEVECAVSVSKPLWLREGEKPVATLKAVNYSDRPQTVKVLLTQRDIYFGTSMALPAVETKVPARGVVTQGINPDLSRNGTFQINGEYALGGKQIPALSMAFAVATALPVRPIDLTKEFTVGMDEGLGLYRPHNGNLFDTGFRALEYTPEERVRLLQQEGVRLFRVGNTPDRSFNWCQIEPKKGVFDWTLTDYLVGLAEKNQVKLMVVMGSPFLTTKEGARPEWDRLPKWILAKVPREKIEVSGIGRDYDLVRPSLDDWRDYITAVVGRYKGRITHYEILNEPNLYLSPAAYLEYLKVAFQTIRKIDPDAKVVGFCATGDLGGKVDSFMSECLKLGGLSYADVVAFHPYDARNDDSPVPAPEQIRTLRKLIDQYRPGMPLWNTELYYLTGSYSETPHEARAEQLARRFLIDLGEGLRQSICLNAYRELYNDFIPQWGYNDNGAFVLRRAAPSPIYVATNAFSRFLQGASPVAILPWGREVLGYVYRDRQGEPVAAFWSRTTRVAYDVVLPFEKGQALLYDLFGNEVPLPEKGKSLRLSRMPVYLKGRGSVEEFRRLLDAAVIKPVRACSVTGLRYSYESGGPAVAVEIRNSSKIAQTLSVRGMKWPDGLTGAGDVVKVVVPPEAAATAYLHYTTNLTSLPTATLSLRMAAEGKIYDETFPIRGIQWSSGQSIKVSTPDSVVKGRDVWTGGADASFEYKAISDAKGVTISLSVLDNRIVPGPVKKPWEGDSIEFYFDTAPDQHLDRPGYTEANFRLFLIPHSKEMPARLEGDTRLLSAVNWKSETSERGYTATIFVPWTAFGLTAPQVIGFDLGLNDSDGGPRKCQLMWSGSDANSLDRGGFGILIPSSESKTP